MEKIHNLWKCILIWLPVCLCRQHVGELLASGKTQLACFIKTHKHCAHIHIHHAFNNISAELRDNNSSEDKLSPDSTRHGMWAQL